MTSEAPSVHPPRVIVDADACPVKDEIYRVAARYDIPVILVAASWLRIPDRGDVRLIIVKDEGRLDAADDRIVDELVADDIVITEDVHLAARCLERRAWAISPRGRVFTEEMIGEAVATRDLMAGLRDAGLVTGGPKPFQRSDRSEFLQRLDETVHAIRRLAHEPPAREGELAKRLVIFGNSGAGKSTLAARLARAHGLAHLDLDTLAWEPDQPPTRRDLDHGIRAIEAFVAEHPGWVIEGCYADLLVVTLTHRPKLVFLNPGIEACAANCRTRPWEPHKYATPEEQDASLEMLVEWVRAYATREDVFSLASHRRLYDGYDGEKAEVTSNEAAAGLTV
jgi:uncharacterized protein YaiI (UPF0178 family)/adenylate kinase family enzyme